MSLYRPGNSVPGASTSRTTEFDLLKASHKFLREEDEKELTWEDQVAKKYYDSLFREFAVCDLKHYKSGNFALRWRTEEEVLSGIGEETCGNTRCVHHEPSKALAPPPLKTVELPFAYEESGEQKAALVKVVLCGKCLKKLMWKREREKEKELQREALAKTETQTGVPQPVDIIQEAMGLNKPLEDDADDRHKDNAQQGYKMRRGEAQTISRRRRSSRSHSPGPRNENKGKRRRSPS